MTTEQCALRFPLLTLGGCANRQQQEVIQYLVEENRVPKERLDGRALRLSVETTKTKFRTSVTFAEV